LCNLPIMSGRVWAECLFGGVAPTVISAPYHFSYLGIPGAPGGVYTQNG
jgi:hypothetical protein